MSELYQGPMPRWKPSQEDMATVDEYLNSDDPVERAYGEVYQAGGFVAEMQGLAAVGEMDVLAEAEFRLGEEIKMTELGLGDLMTLGTYPGNGDTREARILNALQALKNAREKQQEG